MSVANSESLYFNVDPTTATAVIDPTIAHPSGSGHFGSAWRNTNSIVLGMGMGWRLPFQANFQGIERAPIKLVASATKVSADWERAREFAELRKVLEGAGVNLRLPLFLVPEIRSRLPAADLNLKIHLPGAKDKGVCSPGTAEHHVTANPGEETLFTVSGTIPHDARTGDIFLVLPSHGPRKRSCNTLRSST